ncbi:hypothetical protein SPW_7868 [Streptomyces sp. W007]|nr:hypothetical protein SPW_7868 [Streptomyces sp. W007]
MRLRSTEGPGLPVEETYRSVRDHRTVMAEHFHRSVHALAGPGSPLRVRPGQGTGRELLHVRRAPHPGHRAAAGLDMIRHRTRRPAPPPGPQKDRASP